MKALQGVLAALVSLAAVNVAYLVWFGTYDFRIGPLHLVSHGFFKPLLILGTAFYLAILTKNPEPRNEGAGVSSRAMWLGLAAITAFWLWTTIPLNALFDEWNYRGYSSQTNPLKLFASAQWDAWYRPLGFTSQWIDYKIFGSQLWGYHLQNIAFHLVNAYLALLFVRRIGVDKGAARWSALIFLGASSTYEAVMWPSARYDLMAMMFTGIALVWSIDYLRDGRGRVLAGAMLVFALALMCKESGYAFPFLLLPLLWLHREQRGRGIGLLVAAGTVTVAMLAVRFQVLHGVGGYAENPSIGSPHLSLTFTTVYATLTRAFPIALFSVNQMAPMPFFARVAASLFALALPLAVWSGASTTVRQRWLALYALLATIPVAALMSWLDPRAQHVRYLYMPAFFILPLTACALWNARGRWLAPAFVAFGIACAAHNVYVYRSTYARGDEIAAQIARDADASPEIARAVVYGMPPDEFNGVLFSIFQVEYRLAELRPGMKFSVADKDADREECRHSLCYTWDAEAREIHRII